MGAMHNDLNRCNFMFSDDRRCRNPVQGPGSPLCYFHSHRRPRKPPSPPDESAARAFYAWLATHPLDNAVSVNRALNQLFFLVLGKRLSVRRADSLLRTVRLLMRSVPGLRDELHRPHLLADTAPRAGQFLAEIEPLLASATPRDRQEQVAAPPAHDGATGADAESNAAATAAWAGRSGAGPSVSA